MNASGPVACHTLEVENGIVIHNAGILSSGNISAPILRAHEYEILTGVNVYSPLF